MFSNNKHNFVKFINTLHFAYKILIYQSMTVTSVTMIAIIDMLIVDSNNY